MDAQEKRQIAQAFITTLPHARALGITLQDIGEGVATMSMPYSSDLVGDPETGVIHGGAVSTLMDTCSGAAVMSHPDAPQMTATIDLRIEYMRPAVPGRAITATAECHHITRSVAFVRVVAIDSEGGDPGDEARPVATATGAFTADHR